MNRNVIYVIIGTVVIGGGVGAYLYFRKKKNNSELKDKDSNNVSDEKPIETNDDNIDNKIEDKKTDKKDKPSKKTSEKDTDISTIIKYQKSVGIVPNESELKSKDKVFLDKWSDAIKKKTKKGGFLFNNRIYTLKKGKKSISNPIGKNVVALPFQSESKISLNMPSVLETLGGFYGKITDWKFDSKGNLYVYGKPALIGGRWWLADTIATTGTGKDIKKLGLLGMYKKLSFTGGEEEIWAGFDNNFDITIK